MDLKTSPLWRACFFFFWGAGGKAAKRNGMHVHGGRQEEGYEQNKDKKLFSTHGCMRISDQDIAELQNITNGLEKNDPLETRGFLNLTDDLKSPVQYSADRHNAGTDQFPKTTTTEQYSGFALPCYVVPQDNTRVVIPYKLPDYER
jgi:hypothetical protein